MQENEDFTYPRYSHYGPIIDGDNYYDVTATEERPGEYSIRVLERDKDLERFTKIVYYKIHRATASNETGELLFRYSDNFPENIKQQIEYGMKIH